MREIQYMEGLGWIPSKTGKGWRKKNVTELLVDVERETVERNRLMQPSIPRHHRRDFITKEQFLNTMGWGRASWDSTGENYIPMSREPGLNPRLIEPNRQGNTGRASAKPSGSEDTSGPEGR